MPPHSHSEATPQGYKKNKLNKTLLNGNNICAVRGALMQLIPGGAGPEA